MFGIRSAAMFIVSTALGASACCAGSASAARRGPTATWNPLARHVREADTTFMPDFRTWKTISEEGGFLWGHHNEASKDVVDKYRFGPGRFGPAVMAKSGDDWTFVNYAKDGLIPANEFTMELWVKSDGPWARSPGRPFLKIWGNNDLDARTNGDHLEVRLNVPGYGRHMRKKLSELGLRAGEWHAFAFVLKSGTFTIYVDGKPAGEFTGLPRLPEWSDDAQMGIMFGGEPHGAGDFWVSDVRVSRTARIPGRRTKLKSMRSSLTVDLTKRVRAVPLHVGSLHPGGTPKQSRETVHVIRTDKILTATPMKRGAPDGQCRSRGRSGRFSYDWQVCDRVLDWMKAHGVKPYISIDSTPSILGGSVKPYSGARLAKELSCSSGFGPERPGNLEDWSAIVGDFVHHVLKERRVEVPWWGVWNEPDFPAFWNAGVNEYLDLYAVTARAVKAVDPTARVGGPEIAGFHEKWIRPLFERCARDGLPLDFISYHDYSGNLWSVEDARRRVDQWAKASGFETPFPILLGEFNWSSQNLFKQGTARYNTGMWHLRAFGAAYMTAYLTRMVDLPGFELFIYSHTTYGDPRGSGWHCTQLIGPKGEQWAPYNALAGWKKVVKGDVVEVRKDLMPGVYVAATSDPESGDVGIVLVNYGYAQRDARTVECALRGLRPGRWRTQTYRVDSKHSSRWDVAEDRPVGRAHDNLAKVGDASMVVRSDRTGVLSLELPAWSSTFISLRKE